MAEYIDREKLLRDIEKYHLSDGKFQHWVEIQPAADVEHVIHCKDCAKDGLTTCPLCWIEEHTLQFVDHDPEFYCGEAERKE